MRDGIGEIIIFCFLTFAVTYLIEGWLWFTGGLRNPFALFVLVTVMFVPLFSAVITVKFVAKGSLRSYGIAKGAFRHYLCALLYPFAVIALGLVFVWITNAAPIDLSLTRYMQLFPHAAQLSQVPLYLTVINLILAPFINFIPAFGEEYGWRGFLLTKLIQRTGLFRGLMLTGAIWGLWHAPLILMGYNYPHHADVLGVASFTVWTILAGFFLGWLRLKSNSAFPAALGHGAINAYIGLGLLIAPAKDEIATIPLGIPGLLALLVLAVASYVDLSRGLSRKVRLV
jgi:membrane protease YdiL (CAAX protease family)